MELELRFFAMFREAVGRKVLVCEFDAGATVGDVLWSLEREFPELDGRFVADGDVHPGVTVLRNGRNVAARGGVDAVLSEGDTLSITPPVTGGAGLATDR